MRLCLFFNCLIWFYFCKLPFCIAVNRGKFWASRSIWQLLKNKWKIVTNWFLGSFTVLYVFLITGDLRIMLKWLIVDAIHRTRGSTSAVSIAWHLDEHFVVCVHVVKLQSTVPLPSSAPVMSSRPVNHYPPASDMYWSQMDADHVYHSTRSRDVAAVPRYRSVLKLIGRCRDLF